MKNLFKIVLISTSVLSCITKEESRNTIAEKYYLLDSTYYMSIPKVSFPCKKEIRKNLNFEINFHNDKLLDKSFEFTIVADTILYRGALKKNIRIQNFNICMDTNLSQIFTLDFSILDKTNRKLFQWSRKDSYYLHDKSLIKIMLDWDNTKPYEITFK